MAAFVLACSGEAVAAPSTGAITGRVTALRTGLPVAGVDVSVDQSVHAQTTGVKGTYTVAGLAPGLHHVDFLPRVGNYL